MRGIEIILRYLTSDEYHQFKENTRKSRRDYHDYVYVQEWGNYGELISGAFMWNETPQGLEYWATICHRLKTVDIIIEPMRMIRPHKII